MQFQPLKSNSIRLQGSSQPQQPLEPKQQPFWGKDGFTFGDVLDMVNPLHHIPVLSRYYEKTSNDDACEGARLVGGIIYGGLIGGVSGILSSLFNSAVRTETRHDMVDHLIAMSEVNEKQQKNVLAAQASIDTAMNLSEQPVQVVRITESNPFFAHMFDSYYDSESHDKVQGTPVPRSREWGKV